MELRHLRYFVAVSEALSFTKAAALLRLAQPSLTRQVRNLEAELGVRLLDRSKTQISLTEEGRVFLVEAKKILAACLEAVAAVQRLGKGKTAQLNIGYSAEAHYPLLSLTLSTFRALYPLVALNLFDLSHGEQLEALAAGRIDVGFVGLGPQRSGRDFRSLCILQELVQLALPAGHPLAGETRLRLARLSGESFICMSPDAEPGDCEWLRETCRKAGFTARILQKAADAPSAIRFVKDRLGIALLPHRLSMLPHAGVLFRPLTPALQRESVLAWRVDDNSTEVRAYVKIARELSSSA